MSHPMIFKKESYLVMSNAYSFAAAQGARLFEVEWVAVTFDKLAETNKLKALELGFSPAIPFNNDKLLCEEGLVEQKYEPSHALETFVEHDTDTELSCWLFMFSGSECWHRIGDVCRYFGEVYPQDLNN